MEPDLLDPELDQAIEAQAQDTYSPAPLDFPRDTLEPLVQSRAQAEQLNEDLNFLGGLSAKSGEPSATIQEQPKPKAAKPTSSKPAKPKNNGVDEEVSRIAKMVQKDPTPENMNAFVGILQKTYGEGSEKSPANEEVSSMAKTVQDDPSPENKNSFVEVLKKHYGDDPSPDPGVLATAGAVAKDVGRGLAEAPEQAVGGVLEAVNAFIGLGDIMQDLVPLPGFQVWDRSGNFAPKFANANEIAADLAAKQAEGTGFLPTPGKAKTVTGGLINDVAQFLGGFAAGGHVTRGVKMGFAAKGTVKGLFSDFAAFDGHEARLSDLIESNPALANPVTAYLASDPRDSEGEGRLKNTLEGLIPDALFTGLLKSLKAVKQARAAKAGTGAKTYVAAADQFANEVKATGQLPSSGEGPVGALGDATPGAPLIIKGKQKAGDLVAVKDKLKTAEKATEGTEAKSLVPKVGESELAGKIPVGETFINFARINSDDDIKSIVKSMAKAGKEDIAKARRGIRSNAETIEAAGKKYDDVWEGLVKRRTGELPFNAEEQLALRQLWNSSGERLLNTARLAEAQPTAENLLAFRKMLMIHKTVQDQAMAVRTETARALQQWNIPVGVGGREKISAMHNILLQHGGADVNIDLARKFAGLAEEIVANPKAMEKLTKATEKAHSYTALKAVNEAWIGISLLSGPKTHMRNLISNMGMIATSVGERAVASRVGGMLDERPSVEIGEAAAQVAGIFSNVRQAWSDAVTTFKTGQMKEGMSQLDIPPEMAMRSLDQNTLLGKTMYALSYAAQPVFRGLMASDQGMKTLNYGGEIRALAYRKAMNAVRDGEIPRDEAADMIADIVRNPPKEMHEAALETSSIRTFTNDPGKLTKSLLRMRSEYPGLRFIVPFVNTPANVFRTSIEYSPLAPVLTKYRNAIKAGGPQATLARTKIGMGTAAMMEMINLSMDGKITGSGPEPGTAEYEALKRTGWKPYTVRIGDKWVSYRGVEPFSTVMGMGADIGDYIRYSEDDTATGEAIKDMMAIGVFSVSDMMLDRSFMRGLADTFAAVNDPEMNAPRFVDSFASSFVPRGLQEVRNAQDPVVRDARTMMDAFRTRIPYMSMTVPERRDEWGRVQSMESGWGKAYDALSPFYATPIDVEPIDRELLQQGFGVGHAVRGFQLDTVPLNFKNRADIHNRYLELRGQTKPSELGGGKYGKKLIADYGDQSMLDTLNAIVTGTHKLSEKYAEGTDGKNGKKHAILKKVVKDYGRAAKNQIIDEYPHLLDDVAREKEDRAQRAEQGDNVYEDETD